MSRKLLVMLSLLMLVAAAISACGGGGGAGGANPPAGQTFNVEGSEFQYSPNAWTVKPGEKVTINFKNTGTVEHTYVVKDLNFKLVAEPGQTVSGTFTAPSQPGTFQVHCDTPGHTEAGMTGTITVAAASN